MCSNREYGARYVTPDHVLYLLKASQIMFLRLECTCFSTWNKNWYYHIIKVSKIGKLICLMTTFEIDLRSVTNGFGLPTRILKHLLLLKRTWRFWICHKQLNWHFLQLIKQIYYYASNSTWSPSKSTTYAQAVPVQFSLFAKKQYHWNTAPSVPHLDSNSKASTSSPISRWTLNLNPCMHKTGCQNILSSHI